MKRFLLFFASFVLLLTACGPVTPIAVSTLEISRPDLEIITPENVSQIREISLWGQGRMLDQALSPDGKLLAVATTAGLYYYDANTLEQSEFNFQPDLALSQKNVIVSAIVFSPDGGSIAYALSDPRGENDILIVNLESGKIEQHIYHMFDSAGIESLQFSPDGNYLVVRSLAGGSALYCESGTKNIALYRVDNSFPLYNQYYCFHARMTTRFTPNDRLYIFNEFEQPYEMVVIEASTGNRLSREIYDFNYSSNSNADSANKIYDVSADGLAFAAVQFTTKGPVYKLLDANKLEVLETTNGPVRFTTNPNFRWIDHHVEPWELQTIDGKSVCQFDIFFGSPSLFAPDGKIGLSFGVQELNLWDLSTCQSRRMVLVATEIQGFTISPDGKTFAHQDYYNFYLQDAKSGKILFSLSKPRSLGFYNQQFAFGFDGGKVYISNKQADGNYKIAELDVVTGEIGRLLAYEANHLQRILVPNHERILFIENKQVAIWNLINDEQVMSMTDVWNIAVSKNRDEILVVNRTPDDLQKGQLVQVDLQTGKTIDVFPIAGVRNVQYISDTLVFVTQYLTHYQENYAILNLETGEIESQLEQPSDSEYGYQRFALTGEQLFLTFDNKYSRNYEGWIQMRTVNNISEVKFLGKISNLSSLQISPNKSILVSVSGEHQGWYFSQTTLQFWDAQTGEFLAEKQIEGVTSFASVHFSPDQRYIVFEGDGLIHLWGIPFEP